MSAAGLVPFLRRQRALVLTLSAACLLLGAVTLPRLGTGIYPEVEFPRIVVVARAGDSPPELMEASVVRPLEEELATVIGVRRIRSRLIRGSAEIAMQFADGTDMWRALQLTDAAIARARADLPDGTQIESQKVTPADFPILSFNLVGGTSVGRREAADFLVLPALAHVPGVGRVEVVGGDPREMEVVLDPVRLAELHLRPSEAATKVGDALVRRAAGRAEEYRQILTVTAETDVATPDALARLPIQPAGPSPVELGSVAKIFEGAPDRASDVHGPDGDAVQVSVSRLPEASAPEVVREVERIVRGLRLPEGIRMLEVYNQGALIRDSVTGVRDAILLGIVFTVAVLALFLRAPRPGLLAAAAVPFTLLATFPIILLGGQTLNLMSLGGMAISIGLVIDDAIVVVEAITRRMEEGLSREEATAAGLEEIASPVLGTTLTTVVVFLPLAFLSGLVGRFFWALAITLAGAVLLSLLFALFLLPLLAERFLSVKKDAVRRARRRGRLEARYVIALRPLLSRPLLALGLVVVGVVAGLLAWRSLPSGFLPEMDEGAFVLDYFLPPGTSLQATAESALRIEDVLRENPAVVTWTRRTGAELGPVTATELNRGDIAVQLAPRKKRESAEEVMDEIRSALEARMPAVRFEFVQILEDVLNDLSGNPRPLEVRILGEDHAEVARLAEEVEKRLDGTPGMVDFYRGVEGDAPVVRYVIDPLAAAQGGLSPADVGDDLATAIQGRVVGDVPRLDRLVPVRVRFPDEWRFRPDRLPRMPLAVGGAVVPAEELARVVRDSRPSQLFRDNLVPAAIATSDVEGGDVGALAKNARSRLAGMTLPLGYRIEIGGQAESQRVAFRQLLVVFLVGVLGVFALLVAQFRSARAAFLVLLTLPPAVSGAVLSLRLTGVPMNVSSLMGLVLLVGLVVKNGILLVESALHRVEAGQPARLALRAAGRRRLRPILMTTLCTVFGLLPLAFAFGAGSELQRPLAIAVIGGLLFSTGATLFLLPALAGAVLRGQLP